MATARTTTALSALFKERDPQDFMDDLLATLVTRGETFTVGEDGTGYDVKFFGATPGKYFLWDEDKDELLLYGKLTVGVSGTGHDVTLFGDTAANQWLWDESADGVRITGTNATFHLGAHANTAGSAFDIGNASTAMRVYSDEGGTANTGNRRGFLARHLVTYSQTADQTRAAAQLQLKLYGASIAGDSHWQSAYCYVEVDGGTSNIGNGTAVTYLSGCRAAIELAAGATIEVKTDSYVTPFRAELNDAAGATINGITAGLLIATPQNGNFVNAFAFESIGAGYPCGVAASTAVPAGTAGWAMKVDVNGTAGYIPVYSTENF